MIDQRVLGAGRPAPESTGTPGMIRSHHISVSMDRQGFAVHILPHPTTVIGGRGDE